MVCYTGSWGNAGLEDRKIINESIGKKMNIWMMMVLVIFVTTDWSGPLSYMSFSFYKQDLFPSHKEHWNTVCKNAFGTLLFLKNYVHTWIVLARQQFWFKKNCIDTWIVLVPYSFLEKHWLAPYMFTLMCWRLPSTSNTCKSLLLVIVLFCSS